MTELVPKLSLLFPMNMDCGVESEDLETLLVVESVVVGVGVVWLLLPLVDEVV